MVCSSTVIQECLEWEINRSTDYSLLMYLSVEFKRGIWLRAWWLELPPFLLESPYHCAVAQLHKPTFGPTLMKTHQSG